jgi:hypothetical protein
MQNVICGLYKPSVEKEAPNLYCKEGLIYVDYLHISETNSMSEYVIQAHSTHTNNIFTFNIRTEKLPQIVDLSYFELTTKRRDYLKAALIGIGVLEAF